MKKTLLVVGGTAYPPYPGGAAAILYNLLKDLPASDFEVLTSIPNMSNDSTLSFDTVRLPASKLLIRPFVWRFQALVEIVRYFWKARQMLRNGKYHSVLLVFPETGSLLGGWLAARSVGINYDLYIIDLLADSRLNKTERLLLKIFEKAIIRQAKAVFCLNEGISDLYRSKVPRDFVWLPHTCPPPEYSPLVNHTIVHPKTITFVGQIHEISRDALQNLIRAVRLIDEENVAVQLFTNASEDRLRMYGLLDDFVETEFFSDKRQLIERLRSSDILFSPVAFHSRYPLQANTCFPTKTFDYIQAQRPILVHAPADSFYFQYMKSSGLLVGEYDPVILKEGILTLLRDQALQNRLVANATNLLRENHNFSTIRERFLNNLSANNLSK